MTALLAVWVGVYFVTVPVMIWGMARLCRSRRLPDADCGPVSVIVSARNEERDLPACLASLAALDYPHGLLQLVLVNDRSTDSTGALLESFAREHPHAVVVHTENEPDNGLEAKARGLAHGFSRATGDWVLITDADATVGASWVRHMLGDVTARTGIVGGSVVVHPRGLLGVIERMSWAFVQVFSTGAAGFGLPFTVVGPNMGIRRAVYDAAGGLEPADFRVAEDLTLFRMAIRAGFECRVYMDAETTVRLSPVPSFYHLLSQQRRWLGGGAEQGWSYRVGLVAMFAWTFGCAAFMVAAWLVSPFWWGLAVTVRVLVDGALLAAQQRRMQLASHLRYLVLMEAYTVFIGVFLPISFLFRRGISWRGDGYTVRYASLALLAASVSHRPFA